MASAEQPLTEVVEEKSGVDSVDHNMESEKLESIARKIRRHIVKMTHAAGSGHPGGSLSATDILTVLYFKHMRVDPKNPDWPHRDRFVLSKGHAAPALYAVLAERGYFPVEELMGLRKFGSRLQGHPAYGTLPGIEMATGSLGQGISSAVGIALACKLDGETYNVYCMIGDGEMEEGQVWEAAMAAAHYKLDNLIVILDRNMLQIDGSTSEIMNIEPVADKWRAFGWAVREIDGHNVSEISEALIGARDHAGDPSMIIAHTVKGKGVSFMENVLRFHGNAPNDEELEIALAELSDDSGGD